MKIPEHLLAKSAGGDGHRDCETLLGHTSAVCGACERLVEVIADGMGATFGLSPELTKAWKECAWLACWLHDIGKANSHFQRAVRERGFQQGVRHEALTVMYVHDLRGWLGPIWSRLPPWTRRAVLFSVAGHHLKFPDPLSGRRTGTSVVTYLAHPEFATVLDLGRERFGLDALPRLEDREIPLIGSARDGVPKTLKAIEQELDEENGCREIEPTEKMLIACVKSVLMTADLAGSALPDRVDDIGVWVEGRLRRVLDANGLQQVVESRLRGAAPRRFQTEVANSTRSTTLVEAGCGSGKTAAAYLWAARNANGRRLFFCYPTTGTASEGFAGYMRDPDFESLLIHSRKDVDYRLLTNMPDEAEENTALRSLGLEALETWPVPAVVCTAHTVLGLLENVRRGLYAWPSLCRSAFVFDEIHAFDERLFSYLLRFLLAFRGAPVLLMTATLPPARRRALESVCAERGGLIAISGPEEREHAPRYAIRKAAVEEAWKSSTEMLARGGKVLWVCNTVRAAMDLAERAQAEGLPVQPYHSRYRYRDRLARQRRVIDGFGKHMPAMLAVTTQVAEMSLDLSADLLVLAKAPVPSMIQRLGRLNRFEEIPAQPADALIVEPDSRLPYSDEQLEGVDGWMDRVADGSPRSQVDLARAFVEIAGVGAVNDIVPAPVCAWLDGLWRSEAEPRALQEPGYTLDVVMQEDLGSGAPAENAIPMPLPRGDGWKEWRNEGRFLVAPAGTISYDPFRGASWNG